MSTPNLGEMPLSLTDLHLIDEPDQSMIKLPQHDFRFGVVLAVNQVFHRDVETLPEGLQFFFDRLGDNLLHFRSSLPPIVANPNSVVQTITDLRGNAARAIEKSPPPVR